MAQHSSPRLRVNTNLGARSVSPASRSVSASPSPSSNRTGPHASRACAECARRRHRCDGKGPPGPCEPCVDGCRVCYFRPDKRRRGKDAIAQEDEELGINFFRGLLDCLMRRGIQQDRLLSQNGISHGLPTLQSIWPQWQGFESPNTSTPSPHSASPLNDGSSGQCSVETPGPPDSFATDSRLNYLSNYRTDEDDSSPYPDTGSSGINSPAYSPWHSDGLDKPFNAYGSAEPSPTGSDNSGPYVPFTNSSGNASGREETQNIPGEQALPAFPVANPATWHPHSQSGPTGEIDTPYMPTHSGSNAGYNMSANNYIGTSQNFNSHMSSNFSHNQSGFVGGREQPMPSTFVPGQGSLGNIHHPTHNVSQPHAFGIAPSSAGPVHQPQPMHPMYNAHSSAFLSLPSIPQQPDFGGGFAPQSAPPSYAWGGDSLSSPLATTMHEHSAFAPQQMSQHSNQFAFHAHPGAYESNQRQAEAPEPGFTSGPSLNLVGTDHRPMDADRVYAQQNPHLPRM